MQRARVVLRVSAVICRQCSLVGAVLVQQHLSKHIFGKNLKATSYVICRALKKGLLPLFSGCTQPCRISCWESVPPVSWLTGSWGSWFSSPFTCKDVSSSLVLWEIWRGLSRAVFGFCCLHKLVRRGWLAYNVLRNAGILLISEFLALRVDWMKELRQRWRQILNSFWNIPRLGK